jgi:DNA-binding CsgD family transcriptional regulator
MNPSVMSPPNPELQRPPFGLTPREFEVMEWADEGKTNDEIAIILGCAPNTVKTHVHMVLRKLGVENRRTACRMLRPYFRKSGSEDEQ